MAILDQNGNPIETAVLHEPQTAQSLFLKREFAGHPSNNLTPQKLAAILTEAEQGNIQRQHELFLDMEEKDTQIASEMGKRRRALLAYSGSVEPKPGYGAREQKAAELVEELLHGINDFEDILLDMASGIGHGFACLEIEWMQQDRYWLPKAVHFRDQTWFTFHPDDRNMPRLRAAMSGYGEPLQAFGWIIHAHRAKSGYLTRAGLHRTLAWPYLFKNYGLWDLAELLEIYGLPLIIGKYPNNASKDEQGTLRKALLDIGHHAKGVMPEGMLVEIHEIASSSADPFKAMIEWCERSVAKCVNGTTLTSDVSTQGGSRALGETHREVTKEDITYSDLRQIQGSLTRYLVYPLAALNVPGIDPTSLHYKFDTREPEDLTQYAEALPKLVAVGMKIPVAWAHEKLQIPTPEKGEPVLGMTPSQPPPSQGGGAGGGVNSAALKTVIAALSALPAPYGDQAAIDEALDKLDPTLLQGQAGDMLMPVIAMAEQHPEQLLGKLAELFPRMDDTALTEMLAKVFFVAEVWGRLNG